jgi:hypothetical protein
MPTVDERFTPVRVKIERAKELVRDLETRLTAFKGDYPYDVISEIDAQTSQRTFRFRTRHDIPVEISLRTGEVLQNLRSALDYVVCALVEKKTPGGTTRFTGFPVFPNAQEYKAGSPRKIHGMAKRAMHAMDLNKPYKGGTDALWHLRQLNDREKHRLLLTAGIAFRVNVDTKFGGSYLIQRGRSIRMGGTIIREDVTPPNRVFPVEDGAVFFTAPADMNVDPQFTFEIAFNEPQIIEGEPILPTIHQLTNLIEGIVSTLKPFLV